MTLSTTRTSNPTPVTFTEEVMPGGNPEFNAFEALASRLLSVPKVEIDEARRHA